LRLEEEFKKKKMNELRHIEEIKEMYQVKLRRVNKCDSEATRLMQKFQEIEDVG